MTHEKFQTLCEKILVPRIGDILQREIVDLADTLEIIARSLANIERKLNRIVENRDI